jgi:uncharacterized protein (TIGR02452 family)
MGRSKPSRGLPPAAFRKDIRAKKAKATINKVIPALLTAHPRAREGINSSELITPNTPPNHEKQSATSKPTAHPGRINSPPHITLRVVDTLTAARSLLTCPTSGELDLTNTKGRVAILNMASPLSPGGGFLHGATSQEESLCMRTTLLPSLRDDFYRLPEVGAVYTPDVLVFRDEDAEDLIKRDRWFVNCVSAAMLRQPDTEMGKDGTPERYTNQKDRDLVLQKMEWVMQVFQAKAAKKLVLGAWGCGAYGNPVDEVAAAWKHVLGGPNARWEGIEEIVFAISNARMAHRFAEAYGDGLTIEERCDSADDESDGNSTELARLEEVQSKIDQLEVSLAQARSPELKMGLSRAIAGLRDQLGSHDTDVNDT